jgi:hypothetical protein
MWETTNAHARELRASGRTAGALQIISLLCCTMIPEVIVSSSSRKQLTEAENAYNSLSWTILQTTPLF